MYAADPMKKLSISVPQPEKASLMENMLTVRQFRDVVVVVKESEFPAHWAILAERLDVL